VYEVWQPLQAEPILVCVLEILDYVALYAVPLRPVIEPKDLPDLSARLRVRETEVQIRIGCDVLARDDLVHCVDFGSTQPGILRDRAEPHGQLSPILLGERTRDCSVLVARRIP
jgi:hypothetical protein